MKPQIMLLEEPTSPLDVEMVWEVADVMKELAASSMTLLAVTHETGFAREAADLIVLAEEFFNNPRHTRARAFLERVL